VVRALERTPFFASCAGTTGKCLPKPRGARARAVVATAEGRLLGWRANKQDGRAFCMQFATIAGRRLEYRVIPGDSARAALVFLHEGLGCAALWRDFPDRVAARLGARSLVYSRLGYGHSDALGGARAPSFMH
jgi:pimeloyl-ACP methyl ester carboxylesterase